MGVALRLVDFDRLFHTSRNQPIIINDITKSSEEEMEKFNRMIYTRYSTEDLLSNMPMCDCGTLAGEYLIDVVCPDCHHPVVSAMEQEIAPVVWLRRPVGVAKLINPNVWTMLNEKFKRSGFEIIRWIADSNYKSQYAMPPVMTAVQDMGITRGYNNFVENFDEIIDKLFDLKVFRTRKGEDPLHRLLRENREILFSDYLPLPNRSLLVIEESNVGIYVDPIVTGAVDAIQTMVDIDSVLTPLRQRDKENRTIRTIHQLSEFYDGIDRTTLARKEGIFRKHVFGTRSHFSFRAVISSLTDRHAYDELHIPWGIGVSVFRMHLRNKLFRRGMTPNEIEAFLNEHAQKYHPLLEELFAQLIHESPYVVMPEQRIPDPQFPDDRDKDIVVPPTHGIPVVFQRNPSLERGSAQAMFVTKVKSDINIPTVSLSILSVVGFNADFDGDQLNGTLSIDHMTAEELRRLAPHMSTFGLDEPRAVSKNLSMPKPVVATISEWIHRPDDLDPVKLAAMASLPDAP